MRLCLSANKFHVQTAFDQSTDFLLGIWMLNQPPVGFAPMYPDSGGLLPQGH
jgi:hypothetical protein